jgi:hypothetical protein
VGTIRIEVAGGGRFFDAPRPSAPKRIVDPEDLATPAHARRGFEDEEQDRTKSRRKRTYA